MLSNKLDFADEVQCYGEPAQEETQFRSLDHWLTCAAYKKLIFILIWT